MNIKIKDIIILEYGISLPKYKELKGEISCYGCKWELIDFP